MSNPFKGKVLADRKAELDSDCELQCKKLLRENRKVDAVKQYRSVNRCNLKTALDAVNRMV